MYPFITNLEASAYAQYIATQASLKNLFYISFENGKYCVNKDNLSSKLLSIKEFLESKELVSRYLRISASNEIIKKINISYKEELKRLAK